MTLFSFSAGQGMFIFSWVWSVGASCEEVGRLKFDELARELLTGGLSEETRTRHGLLEVVEPPAKQLTVPLPEEGTLYQYRFVKEVTSLRSPVLILRAQLLTCPVEAAQLACLNSVRHSSVMHTSPFSLCGFSHCAV